MIFASDKSTVFKTRLKKQMQSGVPFRGICRRATSLLPAPMSVDDVLLKGALTTGYSNLLISLEANQQSGCLIIQSERSKSRSGILVFRGRILGCVYGKKNMNGHLFGHSAYEQALKDLQSSSKIVDIYQVKEEVVIAASALFHGATLEQQPDVSASKFFQAVMDELIELQLPAFITITDTANVVTYTVYFFAGKTVGIYCSKQGWVKPEIKIVQKHLNSNKNLFVQACIMPCNNLQELGQYSFSLSGLADRGRSKEEVAKVDYETSSTFSVRHLEGGRIANLLAQRVRLDKFVPHIGRYNLGLLCRLSSAGQSSPFSVRP